jgi:hypothetical protein
MIGPTRHKPKILAAHRALFPVNALNRNHAVGQASRRSLTLNNRLEALFARQAGGLQMVKDDFLDRDRRDACPTTPCDDRVIPTASFRLSA